MKTLFIVRHAKSSWDNSSHADFDRPLNERGIRNAPEMARRLVLRGLSPQHIITSPANRAISTARLMAVQFGQSEEMLIVEDSIYEASRQDLHRVISRQNPDYGTLMIIGHNPGMSDFLNWLCDEEEILSTASIAEVQVDSNKWNGWERGNGKLIHLDYPKKQIE
jgi:phosphohistidine phosphatase